MTVHSRQTWALLSTSSKVSVRATGDSRSWTVCAWAAVLRQLQPKVFKQSQHGPVRRCFVISHRMRKRYDFQKRWRRYKQGLWILRAGGDLLASNRGAALIVLWETKSSFSFSLRGRGVGYHLLFAETLQDKSVRRARKKEKKSFFITAREVWIPLLMSPVFTFCALWCQIKWGFWKRNRECLATFGSELKPSGGNKMERWRLNDESCPPLRINVNPDKKTPGDPSNGTAAAVSFFRKTIALFCV